MALSHRLKTRLVFSSAFTLGAWLLAEAIVGVVCRPALTAWESPVPAAQEGAPNMPGNPYLIYEIPPGDRYEQGTTIHMNALGLRGPELEIPKPGGTRRFMTTGDSSVFGFGVADEEVFDKVAAAELGPPAEAVCAAIPGYSTYQSLNLLRMRALQADPDLLVIANIWSDNNFDSFVDKELLASYGTYEEGFAGRTRRLLAHSAIFRALDWELRVKPSAKASNKVGWMIGTGEQIGVRRVAIDDYAHNLETLVQVALGRGGEVVFVLLANNEDMAEEVNPERKAWTPYRKVMEDTATRHGAPLIDVPALFQASGLERGALFLDEMHPTPAGHAIMGHALATLLAEHSWAQGGTVMGHGTGGEIEDYEDPFVGEGSDASSSGPQGGPGDPGPSAGGAPGSPGGDPNAGASPGGDPGPSPGPSGGSGPGGGITISGTVASDRYTRGAIQVDAITPHEQSPQVLGTVVIAGPGPFSLRVGRAGPVALRAYLDEEKNGPDAADELIQFGEQVVEVPAEGKEGLVLDLDAGKIKG